MARYRAVRQRRMSLPLEQTVFDAIVVGSGFGGAVMAYSLSRAGLRTLLVERGGHAHRDDEDWSGRSILLQGRYRGEVPTMVRQHGDAPAQPLFSNEVVGGNSVFFGGAALRLRTTDFARWPVSYSAFEPFYDAAERLLEVHGCAGEDPCEPPRSRDYPFALPAELTAPARRIRDAARAVGFQPFRLPLAINLAGTRAPRCPSCTTCDGFPCKLAAKNDVTTTALAAADPRFLQVVARIEAVRLVEHGDRVTSLEAVDRDTGTRLSLRARVFVISGGAIASAALLLRSRLDARDESGSVGRYLMRHCNGMVGCLFPFATNPARMNHKQIGLSDLYESRRAIDGYAVGVIQDLCLPPREVVRANGPRGLRWAAALSADYIQTLICIAEDEPQRDNRVRLGTELDADGTPITTIDHAYTRSDRRRRALLFSAARRVLRRAGGMVGKESLIESFSHAVGTVRFGSSPREAPLDEFCRFHGVKNLFVVDGSFMPTSGGVNPSLTIAANALRVGAHLRETYAELAR